MHRPAAAPPPAWLAHVTRRQPGPIPWAAMARGTLGSGPLLALGVATDRHGAGVLAGLGAMFASINDRPGTRRTGLPHIGLPALAGAAGLLLGRADGWPAVALLAVVGLVSGAISVRGPVSSAAAVQLLVLTAVGGGMPLAMPGPVKAACYLAGAGWILLLRLLHPRRGGPTGPRHGERLLVAAVFDALADALDAVGTPAAEPARRRLTAALDRADEALRLRLLVRLRHTGADDRLAARAAAASALCEAGVALLWEAAPLPARISVGPRRLAAAVRDDGPPGPLPAPAPGTPARLAFDRAVLAAGVAFATRPGAGRRTALRLRTGEAGATGGPVRLRGSRASGPAGREYGVRVAACVAASAAVAHLLRADHWYWLPVTAAFLVKPDYGPLFSRTVNRFAGTALGVLLLAGATAAGGWVAGHGDAARWVPIAAATLAGALTPLALRHFALQTAAVTVTVLAFVATAGDTQAAGSRLVDTATACAIVLLIGHLPGLSDTRARVGHRSAQALRSTGRYLDHVLAEPAGPPGAVRRTDLRRAAYHALAEARAAAESAAAELRGGDPRWLRVTAGAERIADAATACATRLDHGAVRPDQETARRVGSALAAVADALEGGPEPAVRPSPPAVGECGTLDAVLTELDRLAQLARPEPGRPPAPRPRRVPSLRPRGVRRPAASRRMTVRQRPAGPRSGRTDRTAASPG
ncbi:FUSC family protein [Kitasatospora sp. NPDC049285]|uniref:FUSC family protein n=1 Tax=Kitasatospora sp. NPDC049285 TaxID=3157096 RepID=UPI003420B9BE